MKENFHGYKKSPFAGKVLWTSCKCHHFIRIATSMQNIHRKTFVVGLKIHKNCEIYPPRMFCRVLYGMLMYMHVSCNIHGIGTFFIHVLCMLHEHKLWILKKHWHTRIDWPSFNSTKKFEIQFISGSTKISTSAIRYACYINMHVTCSRFWVRYIGHFMV